MILLLTNELIVECQDCYKASIRVFAYGHTLMFAFLLFLPDDEHEPAPVSLWRQVEVVAGLIATRFSCF